MGQGQIFTKMQYAAEDSAYGTEGGTYTEMFRVQSGVLNSNNGFIYDYDLGSGQNAQDTLYGPFVASGNVGFNVVDFDFLKHFIGNKSGAGTVGDKYTLTEATEITADSSGAGILQPFSIEVKNDDVSNTVEFATGCVGLSFTLSGSIGSKLECAANFAAQKTHFRTTGQTYTPTTDSTLIMINGTWKWGATPSTLTGVQSFTITYDNGINPEANRDISSRFIGIPHFGTRSYKFRVGILMAANLSTTIINDYYGSESSGTYSPNDASTTVHPTAGLEFSIDFINGSKYASVNLDECSIDKISKPKQLGNGLVILTFEGTSREGKDNTPIKWWEV